jgi:hypothetical protein
MESFKLDYPLIDFAPINGITSPWTVRHAVEGVQIFGGIGSGKTSGSGRTIALKYLKAGFGGLVLTVKPDEKAQWQEYCKIAGREKDLIVLEPNGTHSFNFLEYESRNADGDEAITENIVEVLKTVIRAGESSDKGKSDDSFWESALDMLIFNVIDLCKLAKGHVTIEDMYNIVQTLPKANESLELTDANKDKAFYKAFWKVKRDVLKTIDEAELAYQKRTNNVKARLSIEEIMQIPVVRLFFFIDQFFDETFKNLSEKTRSIIEFTFSGFLFRLLREPIYSLFCKNTSTVTPKDSFDGKIILINLPVKLYHKVGQSCQILFKYIWQRTMEQRNVTTTSRPVFLFADEAQNFIHEHDANYQATARSSKIATVYITQNLPNYKALMTGEKGNHRVSSFLGTLGTKIFHANADIETNNYASELIGDIFNEVESKGTSLSGDNFTQTTNTSKELERAIRPEEFAMLLTGGERNKYQVVGVMHRQGDPFPNGKNYIKKGFLQN